MFKYVTTFLFSCIVWQILMTASMKCYIYFIHIWKWYMDTFWSVYPLSYNSIDTLCKTQCCYRLWTCCLLFHCLIAHQSTLNYIKALLLKLHIYSNLNVFIALQSIALSYREVLSIFFFVYTHTYLIEQLNDLTWLILCSLQFMNLMISSNRLEAGCITTGYIIEVSPKRINERPFSIVPWNFRRCSVPPCLSHTCSAVSGDHLVCIHLSFFLTETRIK